jgi:flagellar basal-body rod protein FlgF
METPIYIALSRQDTLRRQMDVIANNIANMNTSGFKSERMLFLEYMEQPQRGEKLSFVEDFGMLRDTKPGNTQVTGNQLDVALRGPGYFAVETSNGPRYTRGGAWQVTDDRTLVDQNGLPLLDDAGARIVIPQNAVDVRIKGDGTIEVDGPRGQADQQVGKLRIVTFANEQEMKQLGSGLYATTQDEQPVPNAQVAQGSIENSNVQPIIEMTQMIEVLRQYQNNQKILDSEHDRQENAIRTLGKVA